MHKHLRVLAPALAIAFGASACAGGLGNLGALGDILGAGAGQQQGQITGEIQQVDTQQQAIFVQTQDGRSGGVRFDQNTVVYYQQQQYPITALERGDVVAMQVQETGGGDLYVSRIDVQQSVREGAGGSDTRQLQQFAGQIRQIDHQRGTFQIQTQNGQLFTVSLPYNPPDATVQYFHRLSAGDTVRLEGRALGGGRVEIYRFL